MQRYTLASVSLAAVIAVTLLGCGGSTLVQPPDPPEDFNPVCISMQPAQYMIPPEADPHDAHGHYDVPNPPNGFGSATPWMQFVVMDTTATADTLDAWVYVRHLRMWAEVNGQEKKILDVTASSFNRASQSGLFTRFPWFGNDGKYDVMNTDEAKKHNDVLAFHVQLHKDRVWHCWGFPRAVVPAGTSRCWADIEWAMSGNVCGQVGFDWWRTPTAVYNGWNVNNIEGAVSPWSYPLTYNAPMNGAFQIAIAGINP